MAYADRSTYSIASGKELPYVVLQVTLKEKFFGTGSGNLEDLEDVINNQFRKGYRLLSMSTSNGGSKGFAGGDRIQATLVFEKMNIEELYLKMQGSSEGKHRNEDYIPINLSATNEEEDAQVSQTIIEPPQQTQLDTSDGASIGKSSTFTKISDYTIRCDLCGLTQSFTKRQCCRCGATFTTENNNPGF